MDFNKWDMRTPWTAAEGQVYNADGEIVADMTQGFNVNLGEAQARAEFAASAANACHEAGGTEIEFSGAHAVESKLAGVVDSHGMENVENAEFYARKLPDGRVFRLFRFKDAGMKPRA